MPDWIKASLMFFGVVGASMAASAALIWSLNTFGVMPTAIVVGGLIITGVPVLFYATLR